MARVHRGFVQHKNTIKFTVSSTNTYQNISKNAKYSGRELLQIFSVPSFGVEHLLLWHLKNIKLSNTH